VVYSIIDEEWPEKKLRLLEMLKTTSTPSL
jgi:hypothetical protein